MSQQTISFISIILLLLGSILMLVLGFGLISSKLAIVAGVVCFIASVSVEKIFMKVK